MRVYYRDMFGSWFFFEDQQLRHIVMMNDLESFFEFIVQIVFTARASDVIEGNTFRVYEAKP